jgi:hypothetical protein
MGLLSFKFRNEGKVTGDTTADEEGLWSGVIGQGVPDIPHLGMISSGLLFGVEVGLNSVPIPGRVGLLACALG